MPARRWFFWLALIYSAAIVYGSLVPLEYHARSPRELIQTFWTICTTPAPLDSRSDALANTLLFAPLGFFLMGAFLHGRAYSAWLLVLPVTLACIAFGACVEFAQLLFPPRNCSRNDILAQGVGAALGSVAWALAGRRLFPLVNSAEASPYNRWLSAYVILIIILATLPFDFTVSPAELVHKYRAGRVGIVPFAACFDPERSMFTKSLTQLMLFLPAGLLLGLGRGSALSSRVVLGVSMAIAAVVEVMQLFVLTRYFEPTDIFTGAAALGLGWWISTTWSALAGSSLNHHKLMTFRLVLVALWFAAVLAISWFPFNFNGEGAWDRWENVFQLPLVEFEQKHTLIAFDEIAHKLLWFVPLGLVLTAGPQRLLSPPRAMLLGATLAVVLEVGQIWLPSRMATLSDMVLSFTGAVVGCMLTSMHKQGVLQYSTAVITHDEHTSFTTLTRHQP